MPRATWSSVRWRQAATITSLTLQRSHPQLHGRKPCGWLQNCYVVYSRGTAGPSGFSPEACVQVGDRQGLGARCRSTVRALFSQVVALNSNVTAGREETLAMAKPYKRLRAQISPEARRKAAAKADSLKDRPSPPICPHCGEEFLIAFGPDGAWYDVHHCLSPPAPAHARPRQARRRAYTRTYARAPSSGKAAGYTFATASARELAAPARISEANFDG